MNNFIFLILKSIHIKKLKIQQGKNNFRHHRKVYTFYITEIPNNVYNSLQTKKNCTSKRKIERNQSPTYQIQPNAFPNNRNQKPSTPWENTRRKFTLHPHSERKNTTRRNEEISPRIELVPLRTTNLKKRSRIHS